jgi:tetratricopeptide (TPR) repeat protein
MSYKSFFVLAIICISCKPSNEDLLEEANQFIKQKEFNKAIDRYTTVITNSNKLQVAYYNRGLAYMGLKQYNYALIDFDKVLALQTFEGGIISKNVNTPYADEITRGQVAYEDALFQKAQVEFYLDSLKSSFNYFQKLVENNYEEISNCILWQGTIFVKTGDLDKACLYFETANRVAISDDDRNEANEMITTYCKRNK